MLSPASTITLSNYPFVHVLYFSGRALCGAEEAEKTRVSKLTEIAYFLAKEEIAFKKFPAHVQQEMRHGVKLRGAHLNEKGCREFTECINDAMVEDLKNKIKNTAFYSVLTDGSTDSGILEKELTYILFLDAEGQLVSTLLGLNDVEHGTAEGLKKVLEETFAKMDMGNFKTHLVGLGADGANVNLGKKKGLAALLRAEIPWLVSVHCFNHRLELAMKDALDKTYYSEITNTLMLLFYAYKNSPKRLRELKALGDIMNEVVNKPLKAHGTRWVQHKLQATEALLKSYSVVVAHLENMANDKTHDQAKAKGILDKVNNFKFVSHLLYFQHLLRPISRLSVTWQKEVVEAPLVLATLNNLKQTLGNMKDQQEYPGELKDIASAQQSVDADDQLQNPITGDAENEPQQPVMFKGTQLKKVKVGLGYFL
ncbi:zinc finger protein 862-like [Apostichopus japonicus]|uniref:zinc finger protein 862-like n=1 Tax=Stichopus japonicus TaxID=307972 RepID=UPI003AB1ACCD